MEATSKSVDEQLQQALQESARWKSAAEAYNQELQHFVYAASHDLQEPLRAVTTYTQLLERLYEGDDQARELTAFITSGVSRMSDLLQNLLTYSRIGATASRSDVQLLSALQVALYKLNQQVTAANAKILHDDLPTVRANEIQMGQLFENILRNSLLFRGKDAAEIHVSWEETDEGYRVSVRDNGIGIEPRFLHHVLLPFKRLHGKDVPGNGLGLSICDKIVKAHGGRLWLDSDGNNGTTVTFTLPY